jgi:hypothetical protein
MKGADTKTFTQKSFPAESPFAALRNGDSAAFNNNSKFKHLGSRF